MKFYSNTETGLVMKGNTVQGKMRLGNETLSYDRHKIKQKGVKSYIWLKKGPSRMEKMGRTGKREVWCHHTARA